MSKIFCKVLKLSLAILSTSYFLSCGTRGQTAIALEELVVEQTGDLTNLTTSFPDTPVAEPGKNNRDRLSPVALEPELTPTQPDASLQLINPYRKVSTHTRGMGQVNSVSQLSDVQPTDWAFQALQNLVERYGCLEGYPDRTFRGNRAMTRNEFAAGLNACLEKITELIAAGGKNSVRPEDLAALNRVATEFQAELATLRGRIDSLEPKIATLEAQQFSTTTKLSGWLIWAANTGTIQGESPERDDPNATLFTYLLLNFRSSFTGKDQLLTQLVMGTGSAVNEASNLTPAILSFLDYSGFNPQVRIRRLRYNFPITDDLQASIFARGNTADYVDFNRYANDSSLDFSTFLFLYNPLLLGGDPTGSGVALTWNPGQGPLTFKAVYRADAAADPDSRTTNVFFSDPSRAGKDKRGGIFGDPNLAVFEAEYIPSERFALRLSYSLGSQGGDGYSTIASNFEFVPIKGIALFGRFGYALDYSDVLFTGTTDDDAKPIYWMGGFSFPDILGKGTSAGFAVGQPFVESSVGDVTQLNMEAFYRFPVNDNISITPFVQVITNPGNRSSEGTLYTGTLRMFFGF